MLGAGAVGRVFSGKIKSSGKKVAIKDVLMKMQNSPPEQKVFNEIAMMTYLKHPNLVKMEGYAFIKNDTEERIKILMELMDSSAHDYKKKKLSLKQKVKICFDAALGMQFLHNKEPNPIIHRDLKTMNVMIDKNITNPNDMSFTAKIADYGVARFIIGNKNQVKTLTNTGTPIWMAPEILKGTFYF
jgi:serine/threonine protein kinase